ncbi:MAG TPA: C4-type zinc ribbon domain-containing protein [Actinomycetota bacterium]|nr:C4-type zinc ribbon domain-containing protein [Actinomycetota bacterium]
MRGLDRLLELQELDLEVDRLEARRRELASGAEMVAAREEAEAAEGRLGELRLALDAVSREIQRLEHESSTLEAKQRAEERRLYDGTVANPKELEALQHEVEALRARRSRLEDELLELMVRREDLEAKVAEAERGAAEARARLEAVGGESARELERIEAELAAKRPAREAVAAALDPELLSLYEEIRRQKKGVGAAALVDGVCQGCHQQLSAMELDRLRHAEGVARCEYCRRILVRA